MDKMHETNQMFKSEMRERGFRIFIEKRQTNCVIVSSILKSANETFQPMVLDKQEDAADATCEARLVHMISGRILMGLGLLYKTRRYGMIDNETTVHKRPNDTEINSYRSSSGLI